MVVNIFNVPDWKEKGFIYIGRPGKGEKGTFGNPIIKGTKCQICGLNHAVPGDTVPCYEVWLRRYLLTDPLFLEPLRDKTLVCFCQLNNPCHGHIIEKILEETRPTFNKLLKHKGFWSRESVEKDTAHNYIFGDNELRTGRANQAIIRGLSNAFGIRTKVAPSMNAGSFWTDDAYQNNCLMLDEDFGKVPVNKSVYISEQGLGTGLAKLDIKAPRTYNYLLFKLRELKEDLKTSH